MWEAMKIEMKTKQILEFETKMLTISEYDGTNELEILELGDTLQVVDHYGLVSILSLGL